jgi:hypothetical protein
MRLALAVVGMLFVTSACASPTDSGIDDPAVRARLHELALQSASISGVPSPQSMIAVWSSDHQVAEQIVSGDIVNDHVPVYVIEMTGGDFTSIEGGPPPNGMSPHGSVLTLTINAETFEGTDDGIADVLVDLHKINPHVVNLLAD